MALVGHNRLGKLLSMMIVVAELWATVGVCPAPASAGWDPDAIARADVLKLRTVCPGEGEYWFPVWLVVIERHVFVRLGSTAAGRVECNTAQTLGVEVGGQKFDVRGVPSPEMANAVNDAMAQKYTADLLMRWFSHPLTLRLEP